MIKQDNSQQMKQITWNPINKWKCSVKKRQQSEN